MVVTEAPSPPRRRVRHRVRRRRSRGLSALFVLGELLVTAGVLLGLFVVWNLVWTDYEAGHEQREALERLEESWSVPEAEPAGDDAPDNSVDDEPSVLEPGEGDPPLVSPVEYGEPFARLHVPRWGEDHALPIREGSAMSVINTGAAGRYGDTQMPGEIGNFAIGAHRQSYGAAFRHIDSLEIDDQLIVRGAEAWYVYEVIETRIVQPHQVEVLAPVPGQAGAEADGRYITLTTCHPLWSTAERYIVHGELVEWYPPGADLADILTAGETT